MNIEYSAGQRFAGVTTACRPLFVLLVGAVLPGCAGPTSAARDPQLRELATRYIEKAIRYPDNPVVRAQAVEAAGEVLGEEARLAIRKALNDEHPGVRFAACMTLGKLRDKSSRDRLRRLADDADPNVQVGAYYALERLGEASYRRQWRDLLRKHENPEVRRNAVLALGRLELKETTKLLWSAANSDNDEGVRLQALEALALLGEQEAISLFLHDAYGGVGWKQAFALEVLGRLRDPRVIAPLRSRLQNAPHLTNRLIAARGLGWHGYDDGYQLALESLDWNQPTPDLADDPPENQIMRVRTNAALALGEIGDARALDRLKVRMTNPDDPRVQLAAATAILMIMNQAPTGTQMGADRHDAQGRN